MIVISAVALLALLAWFAGGDLAGLLRRRATRSTSEPMLEVPVAGMTCQGCVAKLQRTLLEENGVVSAVVTLSPARAVVHGAVGRDRVRQAVERAGFRVSES